MGGYLLFMSGLNPTDDLDTLEEYVSGTSDLNFNQVQIISIPELRLIQSRDPRALSRWNLKPDSDLEFIFTAPTSRSLNEPLPPI